jgi:thymidylate kinase
MVPTVIFSELNKLSISYCHWKSNEHLEDGLLGNTDLDVLVEPNHMTAFRELLRSSSWVRVVSQPFIEGVEDWLYYDSVTEGSYHFHVHSFLPVGGTIHKIYSLDINTKILSTQQSIGGVLIVDSSIEKKLLVLRICLKASMRQILAYYIKGKTLFPENIQNEINWLAARDGSFVDALFGKKFDRLLSNRWQKLEENKLHPFSLLYYSLHIRMFLLNNVSLKRFFKVTKKAKKTLSTSGLVVTIVGVDGSGKTTTTQQIFGWLQWKLRAHFFYFGLPKKSFLEKFVYRAAMKFRIHSIFHIYVALTRLQKARYAQKLKLAGGIVLTDRYPLSDLWSGDLTIDGPRIKGFLKRVEYNIYKKIPRPDVVVYLKTSLTVLEQRDPTLNSEYRQQKFTLTSELEKNRKVLIVDAGQPQDQVVADIKKMVWESICKLSN